MKNKYAFILLVSVLFIYKNATAQDPEFTQFYANPLYLNPALAGSNMCPRVSLNYRNQWPNITATYVTTSASYDKYIRQIKGGLGLLVTNDRAGQGTLNFYTVSGIYAYQLRFTRKFTMNFGLEATYGQKVLDWSKLTFGDQVDDKQGFVYTTHEVQKSSKKEFVDFDAGFVGFTKRFYFGCAASHLTRPNEGFLSESRLPIKITAHVGAVFAVNGNKDASISPNILYQRQGNFQQFDVGLYATKGVIIGGLWYRSNDSFIALVGLKKGMFKCGYSYDITVSKLTNATAGAHEISIGLMFKCKKPRVRFRPDICPVF